MRLYTRHGFYFLVAFSSQNQSQSGKRDKQHTPVIS